MKQASFFLLLSVSLLSCTVQPLSAQSDGTAASLRRSIENELTDDLFTGCIAAVEIADAGSGEILYQRNNKLLLRPASNAKLFTSAAALLSLPEDFVFSTVLFSNDAVGGKTVVLQGGGDPLLDDEDIHKFTEIVKRSNISWIDTLVLDGSLFGTDYYGKGWMWDDHSDPAMPYVSAFSFSGNTIEVTLRSASEPVDSLVITTVPSSVELLLPHGVVRGRHNHIKADRLFGSNAVRLRGSIQAGKKVRKSLSMWDPAVFVAERFAKDLQKAGFADSSLIIERVRCAGQFSYMGRSGHEMDEVLALMNKQSSNLCAESVLRILTVAARNRESAAIEGLTAADGIETMKTVLARKGIDVATLHLVDGSGLSFYNLVKPAELGILLRMMSRDEHFPRFFKSLALPGQNGTLRNRMKNHPNASWFRGKTGTISGVSTLSGYIRSTNGLLLSVVIFMQNFTGKHKAYRQVQDRIIGHCLDYCSANAGRRSQGFKQPR